MTDVTACVVCTGRIAKVRRALAAPFLSKRIWNRDPFCVDLVRCTECGFMFYNPRLELEEEARLYAGYRDEGYRAMRQRYEPWYTPSFNESLASPAFYRLRREKILAILGGIPDLPRLRRILDYGGDRGDLVCGLIEGAEAFVYEISGIAPAEGVKSTSDAAAVRADLIVSSNVLEHVGYPRQLFQQMMAAALPGTLIFVEVPCESPLGFARLFRRIAQIGVVSLLRPGQAVHIARSAGLYMMHEHVNYFSEAILAKLTEICGCTAISSGTYRLASNGATTVMGWCLTSVPGDASSR